MIKRSNACNYVPNADQEKIEKSSTLLSQILVFDYKGSDR